MFFYHQRQQCRYGEPSLWGLHLLCWLLKKWVRTWRFPWNLLPADVLFSVLCQVCWLQNKNEKGFNSRSLEWLNLWPGALICSRGLKPCRKHFLVLFLSCIYFKSTHKMVSQSIYKWQKTWLTVHRSISHDRYWFSNHAPTPLGLFTLVSFSRKPDPAIRNTENLTGASLTFTGFGTQPWCTAANISIMRRGVKASCGLVTKINQCHHGDVSCFMTVRMN